MFTMPCSTKAVFYSIFHVKTFGFMTTALKIVCCDCYIFTATRVTDAPTNVIATVLTPRSVRVTWNPYHLSLTNVTSYIIHYITAVSYTDSGNMTVDGINTTSYTLTNLEENIPYTVTVQAVSSSGGISDNYGGPKGRAMR